MADISFVAAAYGGNNPLNPPSSNGLNTISVRWNMLSTRDGITSGGSNPFYFAVPNSRLYAGYHWYNVPGGVTATFVVKHVYFNGAYYVTWDCGTFSASTPEPTEAPRSPGAPNASNDPDWEGDPGDPTVSEKRKRSVDIRFGSDYHMTKYRWRLNDGDWNEVDCSSDLNRSNIEFTVSSMNPGVANDVDIQAGNGAGWSDSTSMEITPATTGIEGSVAYPSGAAPQSGSTGVSFTSVTTGVVYKSTVEDDGSFESPELPAGDYTVTLEYGDPVGSYILVRKKFSDSRVISTRMVGEDSQASTKFVQ